MGGEGCVGGGGGGFGRLGEAVGGGGVTSCQEALEEVENVSLLCRHGVT